jgi:hypothetical protein
MDTPAPRTPLTIIVVEDNPLDIYLIRWVLTKSAGRPRRSRRGWIGVGRAGLNAQEPNNTHAVPEPSMGEGTAWVEAPAFMPGRTSTHAVLRWSICDVPWMTLCAMRMPRALPAAGGPTAQGSGLPRAGAD